MLEFRDKGIFCPQAGIYIDPWQPVEKAVITHAHSDHAGKGHQYYLCHTLSEPILRLRLGETIYIQTLKYGEAIDLNGVKLSLHPAGHIIGSAQVRLEYKGEIWVVSGDYKLEKDGISSPFEPVNCHTFVTECTFGMPVFKWRKQQEVFSEINSWWRQNQSEGKTSVLFGYALGKAQRLLHNLDRGIGKVFLHGAIFNVHQRMIEAGISLPGYPKVSSENSGKYAGALVLAPGSALGSPWMSRLKPFSTATASGWMQLRGVKRRRPVDRGFVLSDHADWEGLLAAVKATGAGRIYCTHGYKAVFCRYLRELGYEAYELNTEWKGEAVEDAAEITDGI